MDDQTALVLALQLTALSAIAGSILLYLVWKVRRPSEGGSSAFAPAGRSVLVTSAATQLGLEVCLRLAKAGFRVFAACPEGADSTPGRVLRAKLKEFEADGTPHGAVVILPLDCTREDSLHEALQHIRRNLPAGEHGLWGVVNTAGWATKGRLEAQESAAWEHMFRLNVVSTLRTARALLPLLRLTRGRLVTVGLTAECSGGGSGAVAYSAARHAVAGASVALRSELGPRPPVCVLVADLPLVRAEALYRPVRPRRDDPDSVAGYRADTLPDYVLAGLEAVLRTGVPKERYELRPPLSLAAFFKLHTSTAGRKLSRASATV